tara:strand:+ start:20 stop:391 length:372 start_codon:yes stop_codon:yes gene_type:complete
MKITQYFLPFIKAHFPLIATCTKCDLETVFSGLMWLRTNERRFVSFQYQCQECGKLTYSDKISSEGHIVSIDVKCECGGQFRRDKNIFCPGCKHRRSTDNKSESYYTISDKEMKILELKNGKI